MSDIDINPGFGLVHDAEDLRHRAADFYLDIKEIPGGCTIKGHEKQTALYGVSYTVVSPRDAATGMPTGKRVHSPMEVVGKLDKASPLLFKALTTNQNLAKVTFHYFSAVASGGTKEVYKLDLTKASVVAFRHFTHTDGTLCFIASFTFQKIELTWVDGGIMAADDWLSGN